MSYAETTEVSVARSRAEIEEMLMRKGCQQFAYMADESKAAIGFTIQNRRVRFVIPLPQRSDKRFWFTPSRHTRRTEEDAYKAWEQGCRSRWRALYLAIKAKLEAVEIGITTFEEEFLAHFVTDDGRTIGERVIPALDENIRGNGKFMLEWKESPNVTSP
jgi:hypothetical protein